jgi:LacI family transcriptional regulator
MASRPTIADLAKAANVSVATVDRVINGRLPVREETARQVYKAASAIGFYAVGLLRQRVTEGMPNYKLGFVLQKPEQGFYQEFAREIQAAAVAYQGVHATVQIEYSANQTPSERSEKLREVGLRNQAVAMVSPDYPAITAVVEDLKQRGVPVFALLSDFASGVREGYIGLNNRKVGRTAAWMISKAAKKPGKVALFVGSHRFNGHEYREIGFRSYFRELAPQFEVLDTFINLDNEHLTHEAMIDMAHRFPDIVGAYVAGGGMEGFIASMREEGLATRVMGVVNELTAESRAALADEVVMMAIHTPLQNLCRELMRLMVTAIENGPADVPGQTYLPFEMYVPEII